MFDFGGGGNFSANLDSYLQCFSRWDLIVAASRVRNYVINRIS